MILHLLNDVDIFGNQIGNYLGPILGVYMLRPVSLFLVLLTGTKLDSMRV